MQHGGKKITDIKVYQCGCCVNNLRKVFRDAPNRKQEFPAVAVLIQHSGAYYLFDTGYARRVLENGWRSKLYHKLNPVILGEKSLALQLAKEGIRPSDVKGVILSHLHPDHIGGLIDFPDSKIWISKRTYEIFRAPKLLDLIFANLLPADFEERAVVLEMQESEDLFGDGSLILRDVSGHTNGQIGMFLPEYNTFFAADSCWGLDALEWPMNALGRFLQKDTAAYQRTAGEIRKMREAGVRVICSHEVRS